MAAMLSTRLTLFSMPDSAVPKLQLGVSIACFHKDFILVGQRAHAPFKGAWSFAGGRVEPNESLISAANRELFEETGLSATSLHHVCCFDLPSDQGQWQINLFACQAFTGQLCGASDLLEPRFVSYDCLKGLATTPNLVALGRQAAHSLGLWQKQ